LKSCCRGSSHHVTQGPGCDRRRDWLDRRDGRRPRFQISGTPLNNGPGSSITTQATRPPTANQQKNPRRGDRISRKSSPNGPLDYVAAGIPGASVKYGCAIRSSFSFPSDSRPTTAVQLKVVNHGPQKPFVRQHISIHARRKSDGLHLASRFSPPATLSPCL
jgi:hypothetical protein